MDAPFRMPCMLLLLMFYMLNFTPMPYLLFLYRWICVSYVELHGYLLRKLKIDLVEPYFEIWRSENGK